jgi:bifunctional UDP-N-acetylglucosamine pyrophosphorylase / glucosamine-1-phosphate N-acetyltransferase
MLSGVTMYSPENILISPDCQIGQDVVLHAGVQITGASVVGKEVEIGSGAVLYNCQIGAGAVIRANAVLRNCTVKERVVKKFE